MRLFQAYEVKAGSEDFYTLSLEEAIRKAKSFGKAGVVVEQEIRWPVTRQDVLDLLNGKMVTGSKTVFIDGKKVGRRGGKK
jgi:hypothetical protein